jgi:transposase
MARHKIQAYSEEFRRDAVRLSDLPDKQPRLLLRICAFTRIRKRELDTLKKEINPLKKAVAYCAKQQE